MICVAKKPVSRILVSENSLSLQECRFLRSLFRANRRDYNDRPLLDYYTLREEANESASSVYAVTLRCKEKIALYFSTPGLFIESFFIACLFSGDSHIAHADNERREDGRWVPNHTPQRGYTDERADQATEGTNQATLKKEKEVVRRGGNFAD